MRWAGDRCTVCDSDVDYDQDQLVSCDMCGITVHQSCYGVQELPGEDDMWLCRACELKVTATHNDSSHCISSHCWDAYLMIASLHLVPWLSSGHTFDMCVLSMQYFKALSHAICENLCK